MQYDEFLKHIQTGVTEELEKRLSEKIFPGILRGIPNGLNISLYKTIKNNDMHLDGLRISTSKGSVSRIIYLNEYYENYLNGMELHDIICDICAVYEDYSNRFEFDPESFRNYSGVEDQILFKLINRNMNKEYLRSVPHVPFLDLAIVFYCRVGNIGNIPQINHGEAMIMINNEYMGIWGVDANRLMQTALVNTPYILPAEMASLAAVVSDEGENEDRHYISDFNADLINSLSWGEENEMYVLTNSVKNYGAATILYDGLLSKISEAFKSDLYLIPSSIHETLLIPDDGRVNKRKFTALLRNINKTGVSYEEVLSDNIYRYDAGENRIYL